MIKPFLKCFKGKVGGEVTKNSNHTDNDEKTNARVRKIEQAVQPAKSNKNKVESSREWNNKNCPAKKVT